MERNIAVLIDFENIAAGSEREGLGRFDIALLMDRFKDKGRILVARSYADWGRYAKHKQALTREGIALFELSSHGGNAKNRADIALVVDGMELAYTKPYVDTFVLVSGDSDFTPLITKLKELNKWVIGCGTRGSTSRLIVSASDEFLFYDSLVTGQSKRAEHPGPVAPRKVALESAAQLAHGTLRALIRERECPVHASVLKGAMLRKNPSFSETELGYHSLGEFLEACEEASLLTLELDERAGGYRVDLPARAPTADRRTVSHLEGRPLELYDKLREEGMEPLTPPLRQAICDAVVADIKELSRQKQQTTLNRVSQDVIRRLKPATPHLSGHHVRSVLRDMQATGLFVHADGEPVRSPMAPFMLVADTHELRNALNQSYVGALHEKGVDVAAEAEAVASLLLGDAKAAKRIGGLLQAALSEQDLDEDAA
ncbi:MAG: NYN domain-containing protein [Myxococcota bacterium]|nr:NYN domain-containing protein [Myxococcota bacterium]